MRLRAVTLADIPAAVGIQHGPSQVIFARDANGLPYVDPDNEDEVATAVAWFGLTTEPRPRGARTVKVTVGGDGKRYGDAIESAHRSRCWP